MLQSVGSQRVKPNWVTEQQKQFRYKSRQQWVYVLSQLCLTLCGPMDYSLPGSSAHGIFQVSTLELVAISYSRRSSRPRDQTCIFCISCIGSQIPYYWATWEAQKTAITQLNFNVLFYNYCSMTTTITSISNGKFCHLLLPGIVSKCLVYINHLTFTRTLTGKYIFLIHGF